MAEYVGVLNSLSWVARRFQGHLRWGVLLVIAILSVGWSLIALLENQPWALQVSRAFAASLLGLLVALWTLNKIGQWRRSWAVSYAASVLDADGRPSFLTDLRGGLVYRNAAAKEEVFSRKDDGSVSGCFQHFFADPYAQVAKLAQRAQQEESVRERILSLRGKTNLEVRACAPELLLWQLVCPDDDALVSLRGDESPIPVVSVGEDGTVLHANDALVRLIGKPVHSISDVFTDQAVGQGMRFATVVTLNTPDEPISCMTMVQKTPQNGADIYLWPCPLQTIPEGHDGHEIGDALPVALCKLSQDAKVLSCNQAARTLFGSAIQDGQSFSELVEGLGRSVTQWVSEAARAHSTLPPEFLQISGTQKTKFVQISLTPVIRNGQVVVIAILQDVSKLKLLEAQFVQSQKMQAIGQLAGGVAHDFNNLLTAISGHCDLLLLRRNQEDQDYSDLMQIHQNANRAASLVGQLLAFSRKQTLQPEVIDMREVLSDLAHLLNRLVGATVVLKLSQPPHLPTIRADKRQLEQVLVNLVVNSRDAMPDGGEVIIDAAAVALEEALRWDRAIVPVGEYVVLTVRDTGCGIPPEILKQIFDPFFTTKPSNKGTGLGLSTAYGIVKQSGGYIFADSAIDVGTTFYLYLPVHVEQDLSQGDVSTLDKHWAEDGARSGSEVILIVEDEAPVRAFASRALRLRGFTVVEADSAEAALEQLEDDDLKVDIFISDVIMPGLDGPTWVKQALKSRPDTKVIFISGYAEDAFTENKNTIPNAIFLPKPFSLIELTQTVQVLVNKAN